MKHINESSDDVEVKRWLSEHRLVKLHKRLGHALALPSLAAVLRPLKNSGQVFDLYIIRWNSDIGII